MCQLKIFRFYQMKLIEFIFLAFQDLVVGNFFG
jgi:hypothetical protein